MTEPRTLKLGLIQHACPVEASPADNLATAVALMREAAAGGARLIVTQELFTGYYFPQAEDERRFALAEPIPGPTTEALCELAGELGVTISASLFERRAAGMYHNTSVMIDGTRGGKGEITGKYRKMHIPDDPRFYEKYYFTPGDLGFSAHDAAGAKAGMLVCWDQWFPEAARLTAMHGAEVLLYPTAIGWYHGETDQDKANQKAAWRTIQKSHAISNGVFVAAVNRMGPEGELTFWGSSFVVDPAGEVIAEASGEQEQVLYAPCDLTMIGPQRRGWPFWRDRRIDAYGDLQRRFLD